MRLFIRRGSDTPGKNLLVPKQPLKRQIKALHPSCSDDSLKSLSNNGIRRVEAILGFFCQVNPSPLYFLFKKGLLFNLFS